MPYCELKEKAKAKYITKATALDKAGKCVFPQAKNPEIKTLYKPKKTKEKESICKTCTVYKIWFLLKDPLSKKRLKTGSAKKNKPTALGKSKYKEIYKLFCKVFLNWEKSFFAHKELKVGNSAVPMLIAIKEKGSWKILSDKYKLDKLPLGKEEEK